MTYPTKPEPTGYLVLNFPYGRMILIGGPFDAYAGGVGVCLEKNASLVKKATFLFPIEDFNAPAVHDLEDWVLHIIEHHRSHPDEPVFVGCRGGFGRTGTVVSALVKVCFEWTAPLEWTPDFDAVAYTRKHFNPQAVETSNQAQAVLLMDAGSVVDKLTAPKQPLYSSSSANIFQKIKRYFLELLPG